MENPASEIGLEIYETDILIIYITLFEEPYWDSLGKYSLSMIAYNNVNDDYLTNLANKFKGENKKK